MRNIELIEEIRLKKHLKRVYSTLNLTILFFLFGISLNAFRIIENLKISILILCCFIMIFIFKQPCLIQNICLLTIALIQGILFSAIFVFQNKTNIYNLITGMLATSGLIFAVFIFIKICLIFNKLIII